MSTFAGFWIGVICWFIYKWGVSGLFTVDQNERAVKTSFGRAHRLRGVTTLDDPIAEGLRPSERERYAYPQLDVIGPGGPYYRWPWEKVHKVSIATQTINMALDLEDASANQGGQILEAVTRDQLNTGLTGQIRFRVSERNLYAYIFRIKNPLVHVMAFFVSILRERIAGFQAPDQTGDPSAEISINDLRKNLRLLNEQMEKDCASAEARYGIVFDASLITGIDPPSDVESALAAINTAHNQVSSDISLAQASADQKIVQSKRAVEIETLKAQAEVEPLLLLSEQLLALKTAGSGALQAYLRNVRLSLFSKVTTAIIEVKK
jgi:regulator of protease activity HflC (stomatin/prohibitin superfamily)